MPFIITSYRKDQSNIRSEFGRNAFRADATPEQRLAAFKEYVLDNFDAQKIMYQTLKDMETMGVSSDRIEDILQARLKNKSEVEQLIDGVYKVPGFSEKTFEELVGRLEIEDPLQAAKVDFEISQAIEAMNDLRDEISQVDLTTARDELDSRINAILFPSVSILRDIEDTRPTSAVETVNLPPPPGLTTQPDSSVIAQTTKPISLTELAKSGTNLGTLLGIRR